MKIWTALGCLALFVSLAARVGAQTPEQAMTPPIVPLFVWSSPAPSPLTVAMRGANVESSSVTSVALSEYNALMTGTIDRSRLTPELQKLWTPGLQSQVATQLGTWGAPSWSFLGNPWTQAGEVSLYKLAYANDRSIYMSVGVDQRGIIYDLRFADAPGIAAPAP